MAEKEPQMLTAARIAKLFGLTAGRISQLTGDGVLYPVKVKGKRAVMYPLDDTVRRYVTHLRDKLNNRSDVNEAKAEAELEKKNLEIRRLERKVALEEGQAHDASIVEAVWNDVMGSFRMRLLSFPQTTSEKLVGLSDREEIADVLRREIYELCSLLTSYNADEFYARHPEYDDEEGKEIGEAAGETEDTEE